MAVWKYGPNEANKMPDEAVAALQAAVDAGDVDNPFTETHYIRGGTGAYGIPEGAGDYSGLVSSRSLQSTEQYPLIFDVEEGANVQWYGRDSTVPSGHYGFLIGSELKGLKFEGVKFITGLASPYYVTDANILDPGDAGSGITFMDCRIGDIENPSQTDVDTCGLANHYFTTTFIRTIGITKDFLLHFGGGTETSRIVSIVNSYFENINENPLLALKSKILILPLFIHSTLKSKGAVWEETGDLGSANFWMVAMINNVLSSQSGFIFDHSAISDAPKLVRSFLSSNNNVWYRADGETGILKFGSSEWDIDELRSDFDMEANSVFADPKLQSDGTPQEDSPALLMADYPGNVDLNNNPHAYGMDAGAIQVSYLHKGYAATEDIIAYTGVTQGDLERSSTSELQLLLNTWAEQCSQVIDEYCNRTWTLGEQPDAIRNACMRMVSNMIGLAIQRRKSPVMQVGEFNIRLVQDQVMSDDVKGLLKQHRKSGSPKMAIGSTLPDDTTS